MNRFVLTAALVVAAELSVAGTVAAAGIAHAAKIPFCTYEDGNANGKPCMWVDPATGNVFYVTSENYR